MKIALIKTELTSPTDMAVTPPLGLLYLAAIAENLGHEVRLLNLTHYFRPRQAASDLQNLMLWKPDVIGLSSFNTYAPVFRTVAKYCRQYSPEALIIAGGVFPSNDYVAILNEGPVDVCVIGEGEDTFKDLLACKDKNDFSLLHGIAYSLEGHIFTNQPRSFIENLDSLPFPAWHFHDFSKSKCFFDISFSMRNSATIMTSRGCPYRCIYCHHFMGKHFRARSPGNVLEDLTLLRDRFAIKSIDFIDDTFNADTKRAKTILRGIRDGFPKVSISFPTGLRCDLLDEETIVLLREARCVLLSVPIETSSERLQKWSQKDLDLEKIRNNLKVLKKNKIPTRGFFMIGFPTETYEEAIETLKLSLELPLYYNQISLVSPIDNGNLSQLVLSPEKLQEVMSHKDAWDFLWGDFSLCDIPYPQLEKIRKKYYLKGMLRLRNWNFILTNIRVIITLVMLFRDVSFMINIFRFIIFGRNNKFGLETRKRYFSRFAGCLE